MRLVLDIETDDLDAKTIWVIVTKDIDTGRVITHLPPFSTFRDLVPSITMLVGHNILGFDLHVVNRLLGLSIDHRLCVDTLVVSRLLNFGIDGGHSLDAWGRRLGKPKGDFKDFSRLSPEMVAYCRQDVEVTHALFEQFKKHIYSTQWKKAMRVEHDMAWICAEIKTNGFYFDKDQALVYKKEIEQELQKLDADILGGFKPRVVVDRCVDVRHTKHNAVLARIRKPTEPLNGADTTYAEGAELHIFHYEPFNPASPKQIVQRLNEAGWKPVDKTKGYQHAERELKACRDPERRQALKERIKEYEEFGWKVNEENLDTLPDTAPPAAKSLARRILLASRLSSLNEWLNKCDERQDQRIHGNLFHIGAWTQRMSHDNPNTANIPSKHNRKGQVALYGAQFRSLWTVPKGRRLVGVDAEGIQLRVLAHYIDDPGFTNGLVRGDKQLGTDIHSLNARLLGPNVTRDVAKTFIYSWLLGAGEEKTAEVLSCTRTEARGARDSFVGGYPGLLFLKQERIPFDAKRGYFESLDGRYVVCDSEHLMLAGYLQAGEACVMKRANILWRDKLKKEKVPFWQVNFVHDEWQTETVDDDEVAEYIAQVQIQSIIDTGIELGLKCPLAGSKNIGYNWNETH